ncbi:hypothetical protein F7R05_01000 [Pseudomonas koreensis]|nr:hypothetical protein F7R05_01000 [Pseudomonas koreensis]
MDPLWRGSLLPLGCEAAPAFFRKTVQTGFAPAAQSSGSKLPRHRGLVYVVVGYYLPALNGSTLSTPASPFPEETAPWPRKKS